MHKLTTAIRLSMVSIGKILLNNNSRYKEVLPANMELAEYIRCFWGSTKPYIQKGKESVI